LQNRRVSLKEIAEEINSPVAFTAKILHQLAKSDVLKSNKGPSGGFEIPKEKINTLMLSEIVFAIDGNSVYEGCALGFNECNSKIPCPLHDKFVDIRDELKNMLTKTSLYELATGLEVGLTFLKR
jgi:Rrf2 family protein